MASDKTSGGCSMLERWRTSDFHFTAPAKEVKKDGAAEKLSEPKNRKTVMSATKLEELFR